MSELAKPDYSLAADLRSSVVSKVAKEVRKMAADAIEWFADRPSQEGMDWSLAALKLAGELHRLRVSPTQLIAAIRHMENTSGTFRPVVSDYVHAIERVQRDEWMFEFSKTRAYRTPDGREVYTYPETAERNGYTEVL